MTNDPKVRQRATLDFGDFAEQETRPKPKPERQAERDAAASEGFTSRQVSDAPKKIDGRSLRATGRKEQLNIAVKPDTKSTFWELAQAAGFTRGEEFLLELMNRWQEQK